VLDFFVLRLRYSLLLSLADSQRLPFGALTVLLLLLARHRGYECITLLSSLHLFLWKNLCDSWLDCF